MKEIKYNRELYSKTALIKAAYNFTDRAYLHLDADEKYYYVFISEKPECEEITCEDFENEILAQSVRHEIYNQTKNIRELMLARAVATSVVTTGDNETGDVMKNENEYREEQILKDWFDAGE